MVRGVFSNCCAVAATDQIKVFNQSAPQNGRLMVSYSELLQGLSIKSESTRCAPFKGSFFQFFVLAGLWAYVGHNNRT